MKYTFYFLLFVGAVLLSVSVVQSLRGSSVEEELPAQEVVAQEEAAHVPSFSGFPVHTDDGYDGEVVRVDFASQLALGFTGEQAFRTHIMEEAAKGANFAGRFAVVEDLCPGLNGEEISAVEGDPVCTLSAIVDVANGAVVAYGLYALHGIEFQKDSRLLVVNPQVYAHKGNNAFATDFYEMRGDSLVLIKKFDRFGKLFSVCPALPIEAGNPITGEEKTFRTPCEVPFGWEREGAPISQPL